IDEAVEGTRRLRLADVAAAGSTSAPDTGRQLWLIDKLGKHFALDPGAGLVRLGRAKDNDIVLASQRVSRYHVQIRWLESSWLAYDLDSTNGTWVDDQRVTRTRPRALEPGSTLRVGDHELRVGTNEPARGRA